MQLHEFITETLTQIAEGVSNANEKLKGSSAVVNPRHINYNTNENIRAYGWLSNEKERLRAVHLVDFDVVVTATEGKENKGGLGVAIGNIGLGTTRKEEREHIAQNRIKFSIPMVLPNEAEQ
jgi:hypothetical protein